MDAETETATTLTNPNFRIIQQDDIQTLQLLPQDEPRKKRVHRKSRLGCIACKRRRVKCDEQIPCSNCIKRKEPCLHSTSEKSIPRSLSTPRAHFSNGSDADSPINLMHLQLLHHFEHVTLPTLSFPEVWPIVLRQAFNEEFIMSTMLCAAATHLAAITPNNIKYNRAKSQLLTKSLRLLRLNLSRPFTKHICDALAGATVLINYISWCHLDFLSEQKTLSESNASNNSLDLSQDQLFLLSPGVLQVYLQGLPVFMEEDSVFLRIGRQHPRINIEEVLISRGEDPTRFVKPFMKMFDDPQFQTLHSEEDSPGRYEPFRRTWAFLSELELHMGQPKSPYSCSHATSPESAENLSRYHVSTLEEMRDAMLKLHAEHGLATPQSQTGELALELKFKMPQRTAFERVARRLSPILCCLATPQVSAEVSHSTAMPKKADLQRLLFTFPVFCCGPMLEMIAKGDARALMLLFHFYRAVRVLLPTEETWWAGERSRKLEGLILAELEGRGYKMCLRRDFET